MYQAIVGIMNTYASQLVISLSHIEVKEDKMTFRFSYIDCHDTDGPILLEQHSNGDIFYRYDIASNPSKAKSVLVLPIHTDEEELISFMKLLYTERFPHLKVDFEKFGTRTYEEIAAEVPFD